MNEQVKVGVTATIPQELVERYVQHIRDFDAANGGCHFSIFAESATLATADMELILRNIDPPFASVTVHRKQ